MSTEHTTTSYEQVATWLSEQLRTRLAALGQPLTFEQMQQVGAMLGCLCAALWAEQHGPSRAEQMAAEFVEVWTVTMLRQVATPA